MQRFDLTGKVALITGGGRGLGRAMAHGFAEAGADVFISARTESELASVRQEIHEATGRRVVYQVTDMADRDAVKALATTALEEMQRVDVLINNAGINRPQPIDEIVDDDWAQDKLSDDEVEVGRHEAAVAPLLEEGELDADAIVVSPTGNSSSAATNNGA